MSSDASAGHARHRDAWRRHLRRILLLLLVWFIAGPIGGVLAVEQLNHFHIAGMPLGFWMSQQGAIYVFVVLIFVYAILSERADRAVQGHTDGEA